MLGLFGTLNMGARALQTQQQGVEVAGHNLANVNNPAYARQRLQLATSDAVLSGAGWQGSGVLSTTIVRMRDTLLDQQAVTETSVQGLLDAQQRALQSAETALGEQIDRRATGTDASSAAEGVGAQHGLSDGINSLFNAFQSLSTQPTSLAERQVLLMNAVDVASRFNTVSERLSDLSTSLDQNLSSDATSANNLLQDIAKLNDQINRAELRSDSSANDLRDVRQQKLEELANFVNVEVAEVPGRGLDISIGGQSMVRGQEVVDTLQTYDAGGGQMLVRTATGGQSLNLTSGSMAGTIEVRDGLLAQTRAAVNASAAELISAVNQAHRAGFSLTGSTGADFFTGTSAADLAVNQSLVDNPALLQASGVAGEKGNNEVVLALAQLNTQSRAALGGQTFSQHFAKTVSTLGQGLANANTQQEDQAVILGMISQQRNSVSGVSLDEEMTDLMKFQKAYQASAKLVSTIDEMLDVVLNMKR